MAPNKNSPKYEQTIFSFIINKIMDSVGPHLQITIF